MAKTIAFEQFRPPRIQVEFAVSRMQVFADDEMAQIWGHVGDYEISTYLPLNDERVRRLLSEKPGGHAAGGNGAQGSRP